MAFFHVNADVTDSREEITIGTGKGTQTKGVHVIVDDEKVDVTNSRQMQVLLDRIGERIRETMPQATGAS